MHNKHFAVIGAGAGGLCAAKKLVASGFEVTLFELGSYIGGLWVYENDSGTSPAYRSLHINSEARVSSFVDFPFRDDVGLYPDHNEMAKYFRDYAEHFDLTRRIRFNSRVVAVEPDGERFLVRLEGGWSDLFDGVVVASGHQSVPRHPPGVEAFTGEYLHAHSYRAPEPYRDKRVLVIGPGNSGVDIAADICTVTAKTVLSARSPVLIMPRMMFGVPNSRVLGKVEKPFLPMRLRVWLRTKLTEMFHGRMEQWGFRTPKGRTHPISHPTLISHIVWKRVRAAPGIASIDGRTVHFVDSSSEDFDCIIAATGYLTTFPFLSSEHSPLEGEKLNLYHRVVHPSLPGLYFIGYFDVTGGSNIRMMDTQAEFIAAVASGKVRLPDLAQMKAAIDDSLQWHARQFPDRPRYLLELDPRYYGQVLARDYRRGGA